MTSTLSIAVPDGWTRVPLDGDREAAIEAAVDEAFASADRDSSAVAKHWMRQRLRDAATAPPDSHADVVGLLYPSAPVAGVVLPMSAQVLRLHDGVLAGDPPRILAGIAASDSTAVPMALVSGLALRTHSVRDLADDWEREFSQAPLEDSDLESMGSPTEPMPALRVEYMIPGHGGSAWHIVAFTAMVGGDEEGLVDMYLQLCDAFVQSATLKESTS